MPDVDPAAYTSWQVAGPSRVFRRLACCGSSGRPTGPAFCAFWPEGRCSKAAHPTTPRITPAVAVMGPSLHSMRLGWWSHSKRYKRSWADDRHAVVHESAVEAFLYDHGHLLQLYRLLISLLATIIRYLNRHQYSAHRWSRRAPHHSLSRSLHSARYGRTTNAMIDAGSFTTNPQLT
jgi:hypothetical protein